MMKRFFLLLTVLVLVTSCTLCYAVSLSSVTPFKFEHNRYGIGRGVCPVYSAPYEGAYRAANGKACVDTNSYVDVGGFDSQGWLLVRYETNNGSWRVGWIPPRYVRNLSTPMVPHFTYIAQTAAYGMYVSDNNLNLYDPNSQFAYLSAGQTYYIVGRYNYYGTEMWYIEFYLNGQIARGFIPAY